jgi:hypothetical protein
VTAKLRLPAGAAALAAGLWFLAGATAAPVDLPKDVAKAAAEADAAALQKKIGEYAAEPKKSGPLRTAKALALTLMAYGDDATAGQAAKVLLALDKKDVKAAEAAAKGLSSPKADPAAVKAAEGKCDLDDVMSPFRIAKSGGMNVEKDIKDALKDAKKGGKVDPKAAELIGARSAALAGYTAKMPNDKAKTNPSMTKKWEQYAKDMASAGKDLAAEGGKGAKGDAKKLQTTLSKLDASCSNCHNDFRD